MLGDESCSSTGAAVNALAIGPDDTLWIGTRAACALGRRRSHAPRHQQLALAGERHPWLDVREDGILAIAPRISAR
jgi:hypothetical protein